MNLKKTVAVTSMLITAAMGWANAATVDPPFERIPVLKASDTVKGVPLKTNIYEVDERVINNGVMNEYVLHGLDESSIVTGNDLLLERIHEIEATASLEETKRSEAYLKGMEAAGKSTLNSIKTVITRPAQTVSAIPAGIGRFLGNTYRATKSARRSPTEDGAAKEMMGFSKTKRSLALRVGVDPYSSNERLQSALDEVAWSVYAGGMSLTAVRALAVPKPISGAVTATKVTVELSQLLESEAPENLQKINTDKLRGIGASDMQIEAFFTNPWFSPTRETLLVDALSRMNGVENRAVFLDWAVDASSEEQACFIQKSAEMLQRCHANEKPLVRLFTAGALPVGEAADGTTVMALALDRLAWFPRTYETAQAIRADLPARLSDKTILLVVAGQVTPVASKGLKKLDFTVEENAAVASTF